MMRETWIMRLLQMDIIPHRNAC